MVIRWSFFGLVFMVSVAAAEPPAKLLFNSEVDFTELTLTLKKQHASQPEDIDVQVTLSDEARARSKAVTILAMHKRVTLYVNGQPLNTSTVQGVLDGKGLSFSIPRDKLLLMMPSLMK